MKIEIITTPNDDFKETGFGTLKSYKSVLRSIKKLGHEVKLSVCETQSSLDDIVEAKPDLVILAVKYVSIKDEDDIWLSDYLERPTKGRVQLEQEMLAAASRLMPGLGIELVDVRIKRINYIDSVRVQVESRMISERQSIAARFRSEGQGRSEEILGDMERQLRLITSEAERKAQEIIGKADAEATRIYGEAYGADPEFYTFSKTLESYRALGDNATLMIQADSDFFRYLESTTQP
jgi:membrane protease subunit HflC